MLLVLAAAACRRAGHSEIRLHACTWRPYKPAWRSRRPANRVHSPAPCPGHQAWSAGNKASKASITSSAVQGKPTLLTLLQHGISRALACTGCSLPLSARACSCKSSHARSCRTQHSMQRTCSASAMPRVSGSFTFSIMALRECGWQAAAGLQRCFGSMVCRRQELDGNKWTVNAITQLPACQGLMQPGDPTAP